MTIEMSRNQPLGVANGETLSNEVSWRNEKDGLCGDAKRWA
jgi:hypothetical protein